MDVFAQAPCHVYINKTVLFVLQEMEESHRRSRIIMAGCRALQQVLQTVSSPRRTAPSLVSHDARAALGSYVFHH